MFYFVGYCYILLVGNCYVVLVGYSKVLFCRLLVCSISLLLLCSISWLWLCSIWLVIALQEFPSALIFDTVKIILLKRLYEFHMNVCLI